MPQNVYWIMSRTQLSALANPLRHDIVDRLTALGPLSAGALAAALGRRTTAIYRHLAILQRVALVRAIAQPRTGRGRPGMTYAAVAAHIRFARAQREPRNRAAMTRIARAVAVQAARDYAAAFASKQRSTEGRSRNHGFFRLFTAPSPARLARINATVDRLMKLIWTPDPKPGRLLSVAWFMSPIAPKRPARRSSRR